MYIYTYKGQCWQFTFDSAQQFEDQSKIIKVSTNTADKIYLLKSATVYFTIKMAHQAIILFK